MKVDQNSVRLISLDNATRSPEDAPPDYNLRRIFRWYSKEFHTPLHDVGDIPLLEVLQHYWESQYEDMEGPNLDAERDELIMTPDQRLAERRLDDARKMEDYEFEREAENNKAFPKYGREGPKEGSLGALDVSTKERDSSHLDPTKPQSAAEMISDEDIHMTFGGLSELEALEGSDALDLDHGEPLVGED